jgi:hypothetical protein
MDVLSTTMKGRAAPAIVGLCCAAALAACGSSAKPRPAAGSTSGPSLVDFAVCMRAHGLTNFPDPSSGPGGGVSLVPAGIDTSAPAFKRAISACNRLLPGLGSHRGPSAQAISQLLQFSRCMRSHGVTGFPDPTTRPPLSPAGYSLVVRRGGAYLAVPAAISTSSPGYKRARSACRFGPLFS